MVAAHRLQLLGLAKRRLQLGDHLWGTPSGDSSGGFESHRGWSSQSYLVIWLNIKNMFAPTRTLLHTYNRHDHHHHHHHQNHHLYLHEGSKFATPSEQYVDWGNNTNYISMRDQNLPPPMSNMLIGVIASAISPWGIKFATPYEQYVGWRNNINFIFIATWSQTRSNVRVAANMFEPTHLPGNHWWYSHSIPMISTSQSSIGCELSQFGALLVASPIFLGRWSVELPQSELKSFFAMAYF